MLATKTGGSWLQVVVRAGPLMQLRFEGNRHFDASELEAALELDKTEDRVAGDARPAHQGLLRQA